MRLIKWLTIAILVGAIITGGFIFLPKHKAVLSNEQLIEIQAVEWLKAVVAKDWPATYQFTSPGYRSGTSEAQHERRMGLREVKWQGGELLNVTCEVEVCTAEFRVVYMVSRPMRGIPEFEGFQILEKLWINLDGQWWLSNSN